VVFLEAMACGLPVIGSSVGGIRDVIRDGVNGLLTVSNDVEGLVSCLETLIDDPELRRVLGTNGRCLVEDRFDVHVISRHWAEVYSNVLATTV
jgi:glycosyltransferase involved in cell wall biosynthesis